MNQYQAALQPGDIFLTRGDSFISKAIRFFSRSGGESRTVANHTGLVVYPGSIYNADIVEALTTVKRRRFSVYSKAKTTDVWVFRPVSLTDKELLVISERARGYVGKKYGYLKIAAHFVDWCLGGRYVARRFVSMDNYPICSWVVAQAYSDAGYTFGVAAGAASPDDIWDYVTTHPDKYKMVYSRKVMR